MNKGFNLTTVIIIMIFTAVVSGITTGIILNNNYKGNSGLSYSEVVNDEYLTEFLSIYSTIVSKYYDDIDTKGMLDAASKAMQEYDGENKEELLEEATTAMLEFLGDDYTTFLNEEESELLEDQLDGSYEGIGITIEQNRVISVLSNSPAEKAGMLPGDVITKVNHNEITLDNTDFISVIIKEGSGESVYIEVNRDEELLSFNVTKTILNNSVIYKMIEDTSVGYINIDSFSKNVDTYFESALLELESKGMQSLIIDLRYNSGGYLNETLEIASLFLDKGKVIYSLEDKDGMDKIYDQTEEKREYKIVVLINESSASASEILAASLTDSYNAETVGTITYGKGKVQQTVTTADGNTAKYTSAKWYTPNGICIDEIGITPTHFVEQTYIKDENDQIIAMEDTQYIKALELLGIITTN